MSRDFRNWRAWYVKNVPQLPLTDEEAQRLYDEYYACACESCERRKELGLPPVRLNPGVCTAPLEQLGTEKLEWIKEHLT